MKKTKLSLALAGLMLASAVMVSSCKKKEAATTDTDTSGAADAHLAENTSSDLVASGKAERTFDYGTGTCDFNATVTINGVVHDITIP